MTMTNIRLRKGESPTATVVDLDGLTLVFSYETIVAYCSPSEGWVVSENVWSKTTGKHINQETPRGVSRISYEEFSKRLDAVLHGGER